MTTFCQADVLAIFAAKTVRTFCYGFLGIVLPVYLSDLGLSGYNLLGYAAAALGAVTVGALAAYRPLFVIFLAGAAVQCAAYACLPREASVERRRPEGTRLPSAPLIRRLAALGALDSFAGG